MRWPQSRSTGGGFFISYLAQRRLTVDLGDATLAKATFRKEDMFTA